MRLKALLIIAAAFAWCGGVCAPIRPAHAHESEPGYRKGQIHAIQAWARINPVKGRPAAVFFTLHNEGKVADSLIGVRTPIARRAEVHSAQKSKDGMMKMVPAASVAVPVDDMVMFEPGGYHVMLFDMASVPKIGTSFPLTLTFAKGKPQTIQVMAKGLSDVAFKSSMGDQKMDHSKMDHSKHH
jgi:periplasmic copper chaperone A